MAGDRVAVTVVRSCFSGAIGLAGHGIAWLLNVTINGISAHAHCVNRVENNLDRVDPGVFLKWIEIVRHIVVFGRQL